jgi:hypothetical protein
MKIQHFMALVVLSLATVPGARAATTITWTGADPSGYWSAPANWSPAGVPVNGAQLVFPGGLLPGDKVSTNDLTDSFFQSISFLQAGGHTIRGNPITLTNRSECIINSGTNVIACDLTFSGTPSTPNYQFPSIRGPGELTVIGNVGGSSLYVSVERLVIRGQFTGGSLRVQYGSLALYGDNPHPVSVEVYGSSYSTLRVQGSQPNLNITMLREMETFACPSVSGDGLVGDVTGCGSITPDSTLSVKNVSGRLDIYLNGPNVGEYSRLIASGDVSLSVGRLLPSAGFNPQAGQVYTIVEKTSPGPITYAFLGPEGTITNLNGMPFRLSYVGGDGNDVTLTAQPSNQPPTTNTWTGADPSGYWSAPANWSPAGVPVSGNDLVFPGGLPPGDMVSTNDLPGSIFRSIRFGQASRHTIRGNPITLTNRTDCIVNSGTNVIACDLTFTGTPPTPQFQSPTIRGSFGSGELTVIGNVGGGSLYFSEEQFGARSRLVIRGQFTGGSLRVNYGTLALYGDNPNPVSADVRHSTLLVQGSQPNLNITMFSIVLKTGIWSVLSGDGQVGDVTGSGYVFLDSTLSVRNVSVIHLTIRLNGTNVGGYGRLVASGDVSLVGSGYLHPSAGFNPQAGQVFTIVEKTSPGPITRAIFGPEGTITNLNGMPCRISYVGGDGNDVTLTAQPTNAVPIVTWLQPANNAAFPPGFAISLRARATDSDGTVSFVDFFATPTNGPPINVGQGTLASSDGYYIRGWTNPPPGQYQLHAEAVDNAGGRGISDSVQIVVTGTNQPTNSVAQTRTWTGADPSGYWSAPANWSPAGVLVNGANLVFPGGLPPEEKVSTNDLTDRVFRSIRFDQAGGHTIRGNPITLTNRTDGIINSGTNVIACDLTFSGTPSTPQGSTIRDSGYPGGELTVIGNVGGGSLDVSFVRLVIRGQFTGGSLHLWATTVALYGDNPYAVSAGFQNGKLLVQGSQPNLNITMLREMESFTCPSLSGDGVVGDVGGCGYITPDSTLSVKNLSLSILDIYLNGSNVGEYGRLVASGDVYLYGGRLFPSAGLNPQAGQVYTIVEKTSPGAITNAFFGPEGTITNLNGMPFRISYVGGDGNDVTLTVVTPVPIVLSGIQRPFDTQSVFSYSANVGLRYAVERSATWSNWTTIRTDTANTNPMTVTDTAATNRMNFYRVRRLANPP